MFCLYRRPSSTVVTASVSHLPCGLGDIDSSSPGGRAQYSTLKWIKSQTRVKKEKEGMVELRICSCRNVKLKFRGRLKA